MRTLIGCFVAMLVSLGMCASTVQASEPTWTAQVTLPGHAGLGPGYADAGVEYAAIGANGSIALTGYTGDTRQTSGRFESWVVSPSGHIHVVEVGEDVLSLAFDGSTAFLLNNAFTKFAGASDCCTDAYIRRVGASSVGAPTRIERDLSIFNGSLVPVGGRLLAATDGTAGVATTWRSPSGVWAAPRVVDSNDDEVASDVLTAVAGDRVAVLADPSYLGTGLSGQPLQRLPLPPFNGDALPSSVAVVGDHVVVIENRTYTNDGYELIEATPRGLVNQMTVPGVDGLAQVAGDAQGDEIFIWQSCEAGCPLQAVFSRHGGPFSMPQTLTTNATGSLSAEIAMTADGTGIVAWASEGQVDTSLLSPSAKRCQGRLKSDPFLPFEN